MAFDEINAKGGILGRPVELLVEDSSSGDAGTAVQKARKLIDSDKVDFLLGNVNSALCARHGAGLERKGHPAYRAGRPHRRDHRRELPLERVPRLQHDADGGAAVCAALIKQYGKKFYYITPDYAFGHTLEVGHDQGMRRARRREGRRRPAPLGTVDFSSYLIKAQAANPDVIIFLVQGDDMLNAMKQAVQFGLQNKVHLAGAQQEMEPLEGLPPEARIGTWVLEWYWNQPGVPHVAEFVEATKKRTGHVPTARTWFGYVSVWTCALAAAKAQLAEGGRHGEGLAGLPSAAGGRARAEPGLLSRRAEPAARVALRRQRPGRADRRRTISSR